MLFRKQRHKQAVTALNELIIKQVTPDTTWDAIVTQMAADADLDKALVVKLLAGEEQDQFKQHVDRLAESLGVKAKDVLNISQDDKQKYYTYVPWGITSFAELDAVTEAQEEAAKIYDLADQYVSLFWNIVDSSDIEDKRAALSTLNTEFQGRLEDPTDTADKDAGDNPSPTIVSSPQTHQSNHAPPPLTVWKDADGVWKWLGIYSNAFEDRHAEILTSESHQDFAKAFDNGEWSSVQLWPWHLPLPVGFATVISYDPLTKMAIAAGEFVQGAEATAEAWSKRDDLGMSHGMPVSELGYDPLYKDHINRYRSHEFTVLPLTKAANLLTDFQSHKEFKMPIPEDKKNFLLESGLSEAQVAAFESNMKAKADAGDILGLRFKALLTDETPSSATESVPPSAVTQITPASHPSDAPQSTQPSTTNQSTAPLDQPYGFEDLVTAVKDIGQRQQAQIITLQKEFSELKAVVNAGLVALTPQQSLTEILSKDIFGEKSPARVDGRTSLAKDGPLETKDTDTTAQGSSLLSSAIDYMMDMTQG